MPTEATYSGLSFFNMYSSQALGSSCRSLWERRDLLASSFATSNAASLRAGEVAGGRACGVDGLLLKVGPLLGCRLPIVVLVVPILIKVTAVYTISRQAHTTHINQIIGEPVRYRRATHPCGRPSVVIRFRSIFMLVQSSRCPKRGSPPFFGLMASASVGLR